MYGFIDVSTTNKIENLTCVIIIIQPISKLYSAPWREKNKRQPFLSV